MRIPGIDPGWVRTRIHPGGGLLAWLGPALMLLGSTLMIYALAVFTDACVYDSRQKAILDLAESKHPIPSPHPAVGLGSGDLIGRVDIPRVGVSAVVVDSVEDRALRRAVGLVPGTAWPGGSGNTVLAGHRDQLFRGLKGIRPGDEVTVTLPGERIRYEVTATRVVDRESVAREIHPSGADLTLYTCYPFSYIGAAPQRFLAEARRVAPPGREAATRAPAGESHVASRSRKSRAVAND